MPLRPLACGCEVEQRHMTDGLHRLVQVSAIFRARPPGESSKVCIFLPGTRWTKTGGLIPGPQQPDFVEHSEVRPRQEKGT